MPMRRSSSWLIIAVTALLAMWSALVIHREYFSGESDVYLAFLNDIKGNDRWPAVAFLSSPRACQITDVSQIPGISTELQQAFGTANTEALPINLYALIGTYNTVAHEDAMQIHHNGTTMFRPTNKRIVKLSRVGFDSAKMQAIFCVEAPDAALLIQMSRQDGSWKAIKSTRFWGS